MKGSLWSQYFPGQYGQEVTYSGLGQKIYQKFWVKATCKQNNFFKTWKYEK